MKLRHFIKHRAELFVGAFSKLIEVALELFLPIFMGIMIDQGISADNHQVIYTMLLWIFIFGLCGYLSTVLSHFFIARVAQSYAHELRLALIDKVNSFDFETAKKYDSATLLNRLNNDVLHTTNALAMTLRIASRAPFMLIGSVIALFIVAQNIAFVLVAVIPLLIGVILIIIYLLVKVYHKLQRIQDRMITITKENMSGARTIKAYVKSDHELKRFSKENEQLTYFQKVLARLSSLGNPLTTIILNIALIFLLYFSAFEIDAGNLSQGDIFAIVNYTSQLVIASMALLNLILLYTRAFNANKRIREVLEVEVRLKNEGYEVLDTNSIDIQLKDVSFHYQQQQTFMKGINVEIKQGQKVGVIGLTGSGKSTFVELLGRYIRPHSGTYLVNGVDINRYTAESFRAHVSYVGASNLLLQGSIRSNLQMERDLPDEVLLDALAHAQFPLSSNDLDRVVEKDGRNFSGGQRQRLNIARALSHHNPILILDDVFSALDYRTDLLLRQALYQLPYQPTIIMISQRLSSVADCDQILILEKGHITASGKHEELLKTNVLYQNLYRTQNSKEGL